MPNAVPRVCGAHLECHHTLRHQPSRISPPYDQPGARLVATCRRRRRHSAPTVAVSVVWCTRAAATPQRVTADAKCGTTGVWSASRVPPHAPPPAESNLTTVRPTWCVTRSHVPPQTVLRTSHGGAVSVVVHARGSDATERDSGCQMRYHGCVERISSASTRSATSRIESHHRTTRVVRDSRPRAAADATIRLPRWP